MHPVLQVLPVIQAKILRHNRLAEDGCVQVLLSVKIANGISAPFGITTSTHVTGMTGPGIVAGTAQGISRETPIRTRMKEESTRPSFNNLRTLSIACYYTCFLARKVSCKVFVDWPVTALGWIMEVKVAIFPTREFFTRSQTLVMM